MSTDTEAPDLLTNAELHALTNADATVRDLVRILVADVIPERRSQIEQGYDDAHDDAHDMLTLEETMHKLIERAFDARLKTGNHDLTEWRRRIVQSITVGFAIVQRHDRLQAAKARMATDGVAVEQPAEPAPTTPTLPAGWGYPALAKKAHYYAAGESQSLCGRWWFTGEREDDKDDHTDNCAACKRLVIGYRKRTTQPAAKPTT